MKQETAMKLIRLAFLAALYGAGTAAAAPAVEIAGTWECRQAGIEYHNKPPILYVADTGGDQPQVTIEVDGFAREIYGRSEVAADQDGWWKIKPAQGQEFMIRPDGAAKQRSPAMGLRFADSKSDYRCLRLPLSGVPSAAPSGAQDVSPPEIIQGIPPSGEQTTSPAGVQDAAPYGMQNEGAARKE
jgi:hypothetical protein